MPRATTTARISTKPARPLHGSAAAPRRARAMNVAQAEAFLRALAVANPAPEVSILVAIEQLVDDGNLNAGRLRRYDNGAADNGLVMHLLP